VDREVPHRRVPAMGILRREKGAGRRLKSVGGFVNITKHKTRLNT